MYWTECISEAFEESGIIATQRQIEKVVARVEGAHEDWELRTKPCVTCVTTGTVRNGWGRDATCWDCNGKGRVPH